MHHIQQAGVDLLMGLLQDSDKLLGLLRIVHCEEGERRAGVSSTTSTTDTMDVVLDIVGEIVVDDEFDILDIWRTRNREKI